MNYQKKRNNSSTKQDTRENYKLFSRYTQFQELEGLGGGELNEPNNKLK